MEQYVYQDLSERAKSLLQREEDYDVDFKQSSKGLAPEDIVAFANSPRGGAILVGVEEITTPDGRKRGKVKGCPVGDTEKLIILNRAQDCRPPVDMNIFTENASHTPFFRVEIPSGDSKPYCTAAGTYKIRGDGRTNPLTPSKLLTVFLENESREFLGRFRAATNELKSDLDGFSTKLAALKEILESLFGISDEAGSSAQDASLSSEKNLEAIEDLTCSIQDILERVAEIQRNVRPRTKSTESIITRLKHWFWHRRSSRELVSRMKE
jgi:ATP-dependent DNA helicase RecG